MPGGKIQLEAYGEQNKIFSDNPDISYFKLVYKRYTNFAMETIKQYTKDTVKLGNTVEYVIGRDGDLLSNLFLEINLDLEFNNNITVNYDSYLINFGHNIIDYIELKIGDTIIDKHYGKWLQIWNELTELNDSSTNGLLSYKENSDKVLADKLFSNHYTKYQNMSGTGIHRILDLHKSPHMNYNKLGYSNTYYRDKDDHKILKGRITIPFKFWFCKHYGLSIPLIALQYHEVKIRIKFNNIKNNETIRPGNLSDNIINNKINDHDIDINNLGIFNTLHNIITTINNDNSTYTLWGDYIFLDKEERIQFANKNHEYLIEQVQYYDEMISNNFHINNIKDEDYFINKTDIKLNFNHIVKELIWTFQRQTPIYETELLSLINNEGLINLYINGQERVLNQNSMYYTKYNLTKYHSGSGGSPNSIYIYSFSLNPEEFQPMGFCNFSAVNNLRLTIDNLQIFPKKIIDKFGKSVTNRALSNISINIYCINYNILRIMNGMGSLVYSN